MSEDELQATEAGDGDEDAEVHGCCPVVLGDDEGHPVAREREQSLRVASGIEDDPTRWPRYTIGRRIGNRVHLFLYQPGAAPRDLYIPFTGRHYQRYIEAVGRPMPDIRSADTWGPYEDWTLPVCRLDDSRPGGRQLVFNEGRGPQRRFRIYNLCDAQPGWVRYLKRTLMAFPVEHCEWGRLQCVYLDFFVGTERIGVGPRGRPPAVASGGANWPYYPPDPPPPEDESPRARRRREAREERRRARRVPADPAQTSVLCVTYAALNRAWAGVDGDRTPSDDPRDPGGIDAAFADLSIQAGTLYHEFGHIFHFLRPDVLPPAERDRRDALIDNDERGGLFDRYREVSGYSTAARSQGPTEGVAEAYRSRMQGNALRASSRRRGGQAGAGTSSNSNPAQGTPAEGAPTAAQAAPREGASLTVQRTEDALNAAGMPTLQSVQDAHLEIADYVRGQGW